MLDSMAISHMYIGNFFFHAWLYNTPACFFYCIASWSNEYCHGEEPHQLVSSLGIDFMSLKMGLYGMISLPPRDTPFVLHLCLVIFYVKLQQAAVHPIVSFGPFFGFLVTTNHIVFCIMVFFHFS